MLYEHQKSQFRHIPTHVYDINGESNHTMWMFVPRLIIKPMELVIYIDICRIKPNLCTYIFEKISIVIKELQNYVSVAFIKDRFIELRFIELS